MDREIKKFFDSHGGVASVGEVASILGESEHDVRQWARANDVRRLGPTIAFDLSSALRCASDLPARRASKQKRRKRRAKAE